MGWFSRCCRGSEGVSISAPAPTTLTNTAISPSTVGLSTFLMPVMSSPTLATTSPAPRTVILGPAYDSGLLRLPQHQQGRLPRIPEQLTGSPLGGPRPVFTSPNMAGPNSTVMLWSAATPRLLTGNAFVDCAMPEFDTRLAPVLTPNRAVFSDDFASAGSSVSSLSEVSRG